MSARPRISVLRLRQLSSTGRSYDGLDGRHKATRLRVRPQPAAGVRELAARPVGLAELPPVAGRREVVKAMEQLVGAEPEALGECAGGREELLPLQVPLG